MSKNVFYCDLDLINNTGVLVTGHGKGIVNKNAHINGQYIANDMVRLTVEAGRLFGYQGYIEQIENTMVKIKYLLYLYGQQEPNQPTMPIEISVDEYLKLSRHNIEMGERVASSDDAFYEYTTILKQVFDVHFVALPFTIDENERARFINKIVIEEV